MRETPLMYAKTILTEFNDNKSFAILAIQNKIKDSYYQRDKDFYTKALEQLKNIEL